MSKKTWEKRYSTPPKKLPKYDGWLDRWIPIFNSVNDINFGANSNGQCYSDVIDGVNKEFFDEHRLSEIFKTKFKKFSIIQCSTERYGILKEVLEVVAEI